MRKVLQMQTVRSVVVFNGKDSVVDLEKKGEHWIAKDITLHGPAKERVQIVQVTPM